MSLTGDTCAFSTLDNAPGSGNLGGGGGSFPGATHTDCFNSSVSSAETAFEGINLPNDETPLGLKS